MNDMAPMVLKYVWKYNHRDIVQTLKGACWKLLHDIDTEGGGRRRRQARALIMLGDSFRKAAKSKSQECAANGAEQEKEANDITSERIEIAIQMASSN